jgi:hypothetical protein
VPAATNCSVWPVEREAGLGDIAIEVRTGGVTCNVAVPEMEPDVAPIVTEPTATPVARPILLIAATVVFEDDHVTEVVMFF